VRRLAAALLLTAALPPPAFAADYDLYIYDAYESFLHDSSERGGIAMEEAHYWNSDVSGETVIVSVEEYAADPDTDGLGFWIEIWIDGFLLIDDWDVGPGAVQYYTTVPTGGLLEAYVWPVAEWCVAVDDYGYDLLDGEWDGFDVTIWVNGGTPVVAEWGQGDCDYYVRVLWGDRIRADLKSVVDDYDLELYDGYGVLVEESGLAPLEEPDWIIADVGGGSSGGRPSSPHVPPGTVAVFCAPGAGDPRGLVFPALIAFAGLTWLAGRRTEAARHSRRLAFAQEGTASAATSLSHFGTAPEARAATTNPRFDSPTSRRSRFPPRPPSPPAGSSPSVLCIASRSKTLPHSTSKRVAGSVSGLPPGSADQATRPAQSPASAGRQDAGLCFRSLRTASRTCRPRAAQPSIASPSRARTISRKPRDS
jgi:hypothetical protein